MNLNKQLFKEILHSTVLRKYRHKMANLNHFHKKRMVGVDKKTPVEEYGIKWAGGTIMLRHYSNDNNVEIFGNIGGTFDTLDINYYDIDGEDFITPNKQLIKEMIRGLEATYKANI